MIYMKDTLKSSQNQDLYVLVVFQNSTVCADVKDAPLWVVSTPTCFEPSL